MSIAEPHFNLQPMREFIMIKERDFEHIYWMCHGFSMYLQLSEVPVMHAVRMRPALV